MYKGYVYRHWIINDKHKEKSYIGTTIKVNVMKRWGCDGSGYLNGNSNHKFARAIKKYGWNNFQHKILLVIECETEEELVFWLDEFEKYYIEKYNSFYNGYNSTTGGRNGYIVSDEHKKHISEAKKGKKMSEDAKRKNSEAHKGEKSVWYGRHHTEETKQKISNSQKGEKNRNYGRRKELSPLYGKKRSEESIKKQIETNTGSGNPNSKKVICTNTGQVFDTILDAAKWCGLKRAGDIGQCCKGKNKSAGKHPITGERLHWKYYS